MTRVRVLVSFNGMVAGDEAETEINGTVRGWIAAGYVAVVDGGQDQAGQGSAQPDDPGRVTEGTGGGGKADARPRAGTRPRRHRKDAGVSEDSVHQNVHPAPKGDDRD